MLLCSVAVKVPSTELAEEAVTVTEQAPAAPALVTWIFMASVIGLTTTVGSLKVIAPILLPVTLQE